MANEPRAHELCREFAQDPDRIIPGLVLDGWCRTCHVLYCDRCEELTYVPDGQGPECEHYGDDLDDDAKEVLQHAQSGTASPSEVERRLRVSLARLANPVVQPIIGPHAFNMINPSQFITISADNPRTLKRGEANVVVLLNEGQKISPWRRCPTWLATRTARNAVPACGFPLTNPTGQWFDCQICGGSGWMRS